MQLHVVSKLIINESTSWVNTLKKFVVISSFHVGLKNKIIISKSLDNKDTNTGNNSNKYIKYQYKFKSTMFVTIIITNSFDLHSVLFKPGYDFFFFFLTK